MSVDAEQLGTPELLEVRLVSIPVRAWAQAQEHADELLREFALIAGAGGGGETHETPRQLLDLVERLTAEYAGLNTDQEAALAQAAADGVELLDLTFVVPAAAAQAAQHLGEMLDAADEYCRAGQHLLTLATPAEPLAFRRWYLAEFIHQVEGAAPTPWPEWITAHPLPAG